MSPPHTPAAAGGLWGRSGLRVPSWGLLAATLAVMLVHAPLRRVRAQTSAQNANVNIIVNGTGSFLAFTVHDSLAFGTIPRGSATTIDAWEDDPRSLSISLTTASDANVQVTFTLPSQLIRSGGGATIPLTSWRWNWSTPLYENYSDELLVSGSPYSIIGSIDNGTALIFIGATATPAAGALAGTYTASITIAAAITTY